MLLHKGDKVALVAPSSPCSEQEYDNAIAYIESLGLCPTVPSYYELIDPEELYANSDSKRCHYLYNAMVSDDVRAIWALKGGFGAVSLLGGLMHKRKPNHTPFLIGFSDITCLHHINQHVFQGYGLYAPNLCDLVNGACSDATKGRMESILLNPGHIMVIPELKALNECAHHDIAIEAPVVGGCASLVQTSLGSALPLVTKDCIICIEDDRYETPYRIDRLLHHMHLSGAFDACKAVCFGNMFEANTHPLEVEKQHQWVQICQKWANILQEKNIPLLQSLHIGHSFDMYPLLVGSLVTLRLGQTPQLSYTN